MYFKHLTCCPVCKSKQIRFFTSEYQTTKKLFELLKINYKKSKWSHCSKCSHVFLNPVFNNIISNKLYGNESLYRIYSIGERKIDEYLLEIDSNLYDMKQHKSPRNDLMIRALKKYKKHFKNKPIKFLDFGAGFGAQENFAKSHNLIYQGVEIDKWCLQQAERLGRNVTSPENLKSSEKYEIVHSWQVFEHISDPNYGIQESLKYLKSNGLYILNVPTFLITPFNNWDWGGIKALNWGHYHSYSIKSLSYLCTKYSIKIIDFYYSNGDINIIGIYSPNEKVDNKIFSKITYTFLFNKLNLYIHIITGICLSSVKFLVRFIKKITNLRKSIN